MITNERQYRITRKKAAGFARAIEEFDARLQESTTVHPSCCGPSWRPWRANWRICAKNLRSTSS